MPMIRIRGGRQLSGAVPISGAKNSVLPVLAATLAANGVCEIDNCPALSDVEAAFAILRYLGCKAELCGNVATVDSRGACRDDIPDDLMREMRSSISFLGPMLARSGQAEFSHPGGCELGPRPINYHIDALVRMGVSIEERGSSIYCVAENGIKGCQVPLPFPSVGATENVMVAAAAAEGKTVITNAAREPEIICLAKFLNACGGKISGAGESTITIEGVKRLHGCRHTVIPDRIEAATFLTAAAITGGDIRLRGVEPENILPILPAAEEMGCGIIQGSGETRVVAPRVIKPVKKIRTMPYPGFPTDCQAMFMAVAALAEGTSVFVEQIFPSRWGHVNELTRMGAKITTEGFAAVVEGVPKLYGAEVMSTDLRCGAALVVAGLASEGETLVGGLKHIDRGYCDLEKKLCSLGADIERIE